MDEKDTRIKDLERELRMQKLVNERQRAAIKNLNKALSALGGYG